MSASPPSYDPNESSTGAHFKTCLAYAGPMKEYPEGLVISAGQDALIEARQPSTTAEGNADGFMVGHSNQVCSLDVCTEAGWIVSGSWDATARIWQIGKWETEIELPGHTATVWSVIAYDRDTIVTGCADRAIRVFDTTGKLRVSFDGKDIVRALTRLPEGHPTGGQIASASNDGVIRIWTLKGELVAQLYGHEAFIYSLSVLPSGEIVSSGEDRSVRIWQGTECVQVITLPAISVWSVSACPNGDIIAGSSDKMARIFTREQERSAAASTIAEFEESVKSSAVPQQQLGAINMTDLPGPEFLQNKSGTKEGQSQIIKEADGSATLYQWSMSQQTWVKIGQVVDSTGGGGSKQTYNGKEYDYVFDIDIEDGKPALKLPFNVIQNPYDAATKFLQDNELPMTYLEETANFIIKNTQGATLGQAQDTGADAWGSENRYRPGEVSSYRPPPTAPKKTLPQKQYLPIVLGKPAAAYGQIKKLNDQNPEAALTKAELDSLSQLSQQLEKYNFQGKPSLANSSALMESMPAVIKIITQWQPPANRLAGLDLLRFIAAAAKDFPVREIDGVDPVAHLLGSGVFDAELVESNSKLAMISARFLANLLYGSDKGRILVREQCDNILESLKSLSAVVSKDVSLAVAVITLYLNLAVDVTSDKTSGADVNAQRGLSIVEEIAKILATLPTVNHSPTAPALAQTTEPAYRGIVALGTVLAGLARAEITSAAKDIFDIPALLNQMKSRKYLEEPRFQTVVAEIQSALR